MRTDAEHPSRGRPEEVRVVSVSPALGAEVRGVDLALVDDAAYRSIRQALIDNLVLLFRNQHISDADLVAFSQRFGDLDHAPPNENGKMSVAGHPEILVISNVKENGVAIGSLGDGEAIWHSDMNYVDLPPLGSCLHALEVPERGGDTGFCNMYKALEALPPALRKRIEGLSIKHDSSTNSAGYLRQGWAPVTDVSICPGAVHPIIRIHPESARPALFIGRRRNAYIMGLPVRESEALLDEIWGYATREAHVWHHQWRVGDVLMWDNRCTMHRRDAFDPASRRVMHRTQIGDRSTR